MDWRNLISGLSGTKEKEDGKSTLSASMDELSYLRNLVSKLQGINEQQTTQIHYLKEINHRLVERNQVIMNFVHKGGLRQHEDRQDLALTEITRINKDLDPIFSGLEQGEAVSPETVKRLRNRSRQVEAQLLEMREQLKKQRQELLDKLSEKELSLRLTQADMESIFVQNQQLKEEIRLIRLEKSRNEEDFKEKEKLRNALSKSENELQLLKKKYQVLESAKERFESTRNLAQENEVLKKALFQMDEKLRLANRQRSQVQMEYEKLMEEYERLFSQI